MSVYNCLLCGPIEKKVPLFKFPSNPATESKWLKFCGQTSDENIKNDSICAGHFASEDFENSQNRLKDGAIPQACVVKCSRLKFNIKCEYYLLKKTLRNRFKNGIIFVQSASDSSTLKNFEVAVEKLALNVVKNPTKSINLDSIKLVSFSSSTIVAINLNNNNNPIPKYILEEIEKMNPISTVRPSFIYKNVNNSVEERMVGIKLQQPYGCRCLVIYAISNGIKMFNADAGTELEKKISPLALPSDSIQPPILTSQPETQNSDISSMPPTNNTNVSTSPSTNLIDTTNTADSVPEKAILPLTVPQSSDSQTASCTTGTQTLPENPRQNACCFTLAFGEINRYKRKIKIKNQEIDTLKKRIRELEAQTKH